MSEPRPTLRIEGLSVDRGGRGVLHDVSLEVPPGEVTTLVGPNGAGKSTLVLAVAGVLRPAEGSVRLGDVDLTRRRPERVRGAGVAVVPEGRRLLPELTVEDNLRVATYALPRDEARAGADFEADERAARELARRDDHRRLELDRVRRARGHAGAHEDQPPAIERGIGERLRDREQWNAMIA